LIECAFFYACTQALVFNHTLTTLTLSCNQIEEAGGQAIAFALSKSTSIAFVDLSQNPIKALALFLLPS
jgi:Leucine-rich repeat (LRR) protein